MDTPSTDRFATRFIDLPAGRPDRRQSWATRAPTSSEPLPPSYFQLCFEVHYDAIRSLCTRYPFPGVALIAIGKAGVAATGWLSSRAGSINSAILGRHPRADFCLTENESLSLRHLALITHPLQGSHETRFRLLDLNTPTAFADERGRRLGSLDAEGPAFVCCGHFGILLFPTGDELPWPADPRSGWQCLPERIYFDDLAAEPDRWQRARFESPAAACPARRRQTTIRTSEAPMRACRHLLRAGDPPLGRLVLRSDRGTETALVGRAAAQRGVLLGRYERCDVDGLQALAQARVSRVHCLLLSVQETTYLIDTASTNGIGPGADTTSPVGRSPGRSRMVVLGTGARVGLGRGAAELHWQALQ